MPYKVNPPLYHIWRSMLSRCYDKNNLQYKDYGGRGIIVCPEWQHNYKKWYQDVSSGYVKGLTFDRRNNNGNYEPGNVRWATRKEQQRNRRCTIKFEFDGVAYTAAELAEQSGLKFDTIVDRAKQGLSLAEVVSTKKRLNLTGFALGATISASRRRAKTRCKNGHFYTEENTRVDTDKRGYSFRVCRLCHSERQKRNY